MRILYSIYTGEYPNQFAGGPNNIIYKLIKNAPKKNFQFDYLSSDLFIEKVVADNLFALRNNLSPKKKTASLLSEKSKLYRKFFGSDFYLPYHFYKKNKYYENFSNRIKKYDIIHSQDSIGLSLIAKGNSSSKKVMTIHSKGPLSDEIREMPKSENLKKRIDTTLKAIEFKNVELADIITFPSIAAKNYFEKSLGVSLKKSKIKIIYNGIDLDAITELNDYDILKKYSIINEKGKLLLLNIAANAPEKNLDVLLKVVGLLKNKFNKEIFLLNIGADKEIPNELKNIIKEMNIRTDVKFLGKLPNKDVIKLLKATDIFIMTSEKVIFDLVVLEALAAGTCCVVSNEGGNKEIIKDGQNGFLIDITDVDAIAKKIISIIPYKNKVKENSIKTAKQFSVQKMVDEYFEVYEGLLNGV